MDIEEKFKRLNEIKQEMRELFPELYEAYVEKKNSAPVKFSTKEDGRVFVSVRGGMPIEAGDDRDSAIEFVEKLLGKKLRVR